MPNNCFFMPTPQKRPKMPNYDVHAKQLQKRPNFRNLALKMPTWQPWCRRTVKIVLYSVLIKVARYFV